MTIPMIAPPRAVKAFHTVLLDGLRRSNLVSGADAQDVLVLARELVEAVERAMHAAATREAYARGYIDGAVGYSETVSVERVRHEAADRWDRDYA
jgi:hypothetical protein